VREHLEPVLERERQSQRFGKRDVVIDDQDRCSRVHFAPWLERTELGALCTNRTATARCWHGLKTHGARLKSGHDK
jgi:hypothetical protein